MKEVRTGIKVEIAVKRFGLLRAAFLAISLVALSANLASAQLHHGHHYSHYHHGSTGTIAYRGLNLRPSYGGLIVGNGYVTGYGPNYATYFPPSYWGGGFIGGPVVGAPLSIPADSLFGPAAVWRMIGLDPPPLQPTPAVAPAAAPTKPGFGVLANPNPQPAAPQVRATNEPTRFRAMQFMAAGDEHFRKQRFNSAYQRYKDAGTTAPDLAEAFFRQGFALAAMSQYSSAAKAIKRGLQLKPDWPESGFRLDVIYGDNHLAKTAHRDALAQAATEQPGNGDLLFLLGIALYFDGQADRSAIFFERAKLLEPGDITHIKLFLDQLAKQQAAKAVVQPVAQPREI
jgi:hypothetical protein